METIILDFTKPTNKVLQIFLTNFSNGLKKSGSLFHQINLNDVYILDCLGCTEDIFFVSNGKCKCNDELEKVYPLLMSSQIWVFALDITESKSIEQFIKVLNRMEPIFTLSLNGDKSLPKKKVMCLLFSREGKSQPQYILNLLKEFAKLFNYDYLGSVFRTKYSLFEFMPESVINSFAFNQDYYNLAFELVTNGLLNNVIVERIQREIVPKDSFLQDILALLKSV
ncbi:MAG: hypothetical protein N2560_08590 [Ignavibacteria bacterium]|nr:hypothetical protein [Ignavibacteria bacterium]